MQHIKSSVLRCVRLSCNSRLVVVGDGGRNAGKLARLMCGFASKNGSEEITSRVIELVKKFDRLDASKVFAFLWIWFFDLVPCLLGCILDWFSLKLWCYPMYACLPLQRLKLIVILFASLCVVWPYYFSIIKHNSLQLWSPVFSRCWFTRLP